MKIMPPLKVSLIVSYPNGIYRETVGPYFYSGDSVNLYLGDMPQHWLEVHISHMGDCSGNTATGTFELPREFYYNG